MLGVYSLLRPSPKAALKATLQSVGQAVAAGDVDGVMEHISPYFLEEGMEAKDLRRNLERVLPSRPVTRVSIVLRQWSRRGAWARVVVTVRSEHSSIRNSRARSNWVIDLEWMDGRWMVRKGMPTLVNGQRVAGLRSVFTRARR